MSKATKERADRPIDLLTPREAVFLKTFHRSMVCHSYEACVDSPARRDMLCLLESMLETVNTDRLIDCIKFVAKKAGESDPPPFDDDEDMFKMCAVDAMWYREEADKLDAKKKTRRPRGGGVE